MIFRQLAGIEPAGIDQMEEELEADSSGDDDEGADAGISSADIDVAGSFSLDYR